MLVIKFQKSEIWNSKKNLQKPYGLDGEYWLLEYNISRKRDLWKCWSPDLDTDKRGLSSFLSLALDMVGLSNGDLSDYEYLQRGVSVTHEK